MLLSSGLIENLPSIITAMGTIILGWFTYNQYSKNKKTDIKIEQWKEDTIRKRRQDAGSIATCFGCLWELLHYLKAGRVYLIQPHPLSKAMYISSTLEVRRNGVTTVKESMENISINLIAKFTSQLANKDFIFIPDVDNCEMDKKMKSIMMYNGCGIVAIRRLTDDDNKWVGNIVIGFPKGTDPLTEDEYKSVEKLSKDAALIVLGILPEYIE